MGMGPEQYGSMKITTARFYRIDGRSTQVQGVEADIRLPSLLDSLDIGEDKLTYALPFTRIRPANYAKCWSLDRHIPELRKLSEERLAADERYLQHLGNVSGMKEMSEREEVPLERAARTALMKSEREIRELDQEDGFGADDDLISADDAADDDLVPADEGADDGEKKIEKKKPRRRRNQLKEDDVVLDEAFRILADLIRLNGEEKMPATKMDWYNAIMGF